MTNNRKNKAGLALSLAIAGTLATSNGLSNPGNLLSGLLTSTGIVCAFGGLLTHRRYNLGAGDYGEVLGEAYKETLSNIQWGTDGLVDPRKALTAVVKFNFVPKAVKTSVQTMIDSAAGDWWNDATLRRLSIMMVGKSGSGKTTLLLNLIYDYMQGKVEPRLKILDINYGKPDERGERNTWFNLPASITTQNYIVATSPDDCVASLKNYFEEFDKVREAWRKGAQSKPEDNLLIIDEYIGLLEFYKDKGDKKTVEQLTSWVSQILKQGRAYGFRMILGLQECSVDSTGLSTSDQDQLNIIVLGDSIKHRMAIERLQLEDSKGWKERVNDFVASIGKDKRIAAVKIGGAEPTLKIVPHLGTPDVTYEFPELDPSKVWLNEKLVEHAGAIADNLSLKDLAELFGIEQRNTEPRYAALKNHLQEIHSNA